MADGRIKAMATPHQASERECIGYESGVSLTVPVSER
jgi:hypothetical protein